MQFTNEFIVPLPPDEAFAILTDLERVVPCMPGAALLDVDGDTYRGRVKVKLGPMTLTYEGTASLVEADPINHVARIEASAQETRNTGTVRAAVTSSLVDAGGQALVRVVTDVDITGRPAQLGRGVMADVGATLIELFAACLAEQLQQREALPEPDASSDPALSGPAGRSALSPAPLSQDSLDVGSLAAAIARKRLVPLAVAAAIGLLIGRWTRR